MNSSELIKITLAALPFILEAERDPPIPQHTSRRTGALYYEELMQTPNENRFRNVARMDKATFMKLLHVLVTNTHLQDGRKLLAGEKLMVFIHALVGYTNRHIAEIWQHSGSTISETIHEVAHNFLSISEYFFKQPTANDVISPTITNNPKFAPYFGNCIEALDGTHIPAVIVEGDQKPFRNRKGLITQNVLGVALFDMTFSFVLAGWEGSAHDGRVLHDAILKGLFVADGKFYLGDAGYSLTPHCLTSYRRGTRYHLKEWINSNQEPQNREELFNLRHASLRNVIERAFGVLKKRFPLLKQMNSYFLEFQIQLILCCFMTHNFVRRNQGYEDEFDHLIEEDEADDDHQVGNDLLNQNNNDVDEWRDQLAQ